MSDLRLLYLTDLHGDAEAYRRAAALARERELHYLFLGGDLLPKESGVLEAQGRFLDDFVEDWLAGLRADGREVWLQFGNDDCAALLGKLDRLVEQGLTRRLDQGPSPIADTGFTVLGYPYVPEYPFGLKDWVKLDYRGAPPSNQLGLPVLTVSGGLEKIPDLEAFFADRPTIEEDLGNLPALAAPERTVVVLHAPPTGCGLDVCWDGTQAGSRSIRRFIEERQPLLALHGHIHESPEETGVWQARIGETLVVQPGPRAVIVEIEGREVALERIERAIP